MEVVGGCVGDLVGITCGYSDGVLVGAEVLVQQMVKLRILTDSDSNQPNFMDKVW